MDAREERLARNEAVFREINEKVLAVASRHGVDAHVYSFFCECSNRDCLLQVSLSLPAYEAVRAHSERFVVAPGHWFPEIERSIESTAAYEVIEKQGEAADLVDDLDPRG